MAGERTEAPTTKRLRDARKRGQVSKSQEVVSIGTLLVAALALRMTGPDLASGLMDMMREGFASMPAGDLNQGSANEMGREWALRAALAMAPLFAILAVTGVALNLAQTGFILSGDRLKPKFNHISPMQGLKRIFATEGLINLAKALIKMGIVAGVIAWVMRKRLQEIAALGTVPLGEGMARLAAIAFDVALWAAGVLFVLTLFDHAWQRRKHFRDLRMSKDEVRQEMKETEGDPQIKGAIRRRRQALLNRMIAAVPKADVVVTNPTHYAVALKYDPVTMKAPVVLAKGERLLALRIKEVARKAGVPVLEEPPLARALFKSVAVGNPIPANLFHAVAEVLAWVYSLREQARRRPWRSTASAQGAG
jgi:flagellar biosynthetic protein FlhB